MDEPCGSTIPNGGIDPIKDFGPNKSGPFEGLMTLPPRRSYQDKLGKRNANAGDNKESAQVVALSAPTAKQTKKMVRDTEDDDLGKKKLDSIWVMGDKTIAREIMKKAGVPTSSKEAMKFAHEIDFPVMIKATTGGGGCAMRLTKESDEFMKLLQVEIILMGQLIFVNYEID
ncbi:hypothetical protein ZIOFF_024585 [Zingiber officinale]|uniref:Carbamoyl phosphate synthase ATP-binding domain-containing protein n=1 Tax=Zingiber officinale TaxID=94328 RepID=A0A8J5GTS8_ZINOF|nr:hypothetical protein ZIOFF_024585 [Zingiber officinale]